MPSNHETFFQNDRFAVVGHSQKRPFPALTYKGLKKLGKTVFAVDKTAKTIEGDKAYADLDSLPEAVQAVVLEVPKHETRDWVDAAGKKGIKDVWIHMQRDTPEALSAAEEHGINARTGTCAVMYVTPGFTYHAIHRGIMKLTGKY